MALRVVVVSNGNAFSTTMIRPLVEDPGIDVVGALIVSLPSGRGGPLATLWRLTRRTGVRFATYKALSLAVPAIAGRRFHAPVFLRELCRSRGVPVRSVRSVNGEEAAAFLRRATPDVIVSVSTPERILPEVLAIARVAPVNVHWALLPAYGGIAPYVWVLRNGERETGVTVHVMNERLDTGPILRRRLVEITRDDTALSLQMRLASVAAEELHGAVRELPKSLETAEEQPAGGRSYYTWPRRSDVRGLRRRGRRLTRWRDLRSMWSEARALRG
ncbi:MAG: methionyl-tRNA formyltransferase [Actinomycetota bacterium]